MPPLPVITRPADRSVVEGDTLTVAGRATPHARICVLDWDQGIASTTADERGEWSVSLSRARDHDHVLRAEMLDPEGRAIAASAPSVVYVPERESDAAEPRSAPGGFLPQLGKGRGLGSLLSRGRRPGTHGRVPSDPYGDEPHDGDPLDSAPDGMWEGAERVEDRLEAGDAGPPIRLERESVSTAPLEAAEEASSAERPRDVSRATLLTRGQGPAAKSGARAVRQDGEALELEVQEVTVARPQVVEAELQDVRSTTSQDEPEPLKVVETRRARQGRSIR